MNSDITNLYEYSIIRYLPRIERGEFVNVGLIMMCKRRRWIRVAIHIPLQRVALMNPPHDPDTLIHQLSQFERVAAGLKDAGEMASLPVEERYRWLTAVRSASIRTSPSHPGLCADLDCTFDTLFRELVE
ncbi:MAG: DUF3037 domain-containing protein [Paramuribaculum sp.]|nr:DUF3037 domain-containing protein [Paramuribaculum sp.]MDE7471859.1 DUF3037 domain-containing protein [Paramuribaculum sp.]